MLQTTLLSNNYLTIHANVIISINPDIATLTGWDKSVISCITLLIPL